MPQVNGARRRGQSGNRRSEVRSAYLFLTPSLLAFVCFVAAPLVYVVYLSFTKYNIITPAVFNDAKNWIRLTLDKRFLATLGNSMKFVLLLVPMHMVVGLLLAAGVSSLKHKAGLYGLRTVYYFPTLIATSSVAMAWEFIFSTDVGMLNYFLARMGLAKIPWLMSSFWVYPAVMIFSLWKFIGGYFLYFLIGFLGIDKTYHEAAAIDGADAFRKFFSISLPMLSPTIFFVMITNIIGCVQIFDEPYLLTHGGPGDASRSLSLYIYETAYQSNNYGYASAIALVLLAVVLAITLIQFKFSGTWVNYDRE